LTLIVDGDDFVNGASQIELARFHLDRPPRGRLNRLDNAPRIPFAGGGESQQQTGLVLVADQQPAEASDRGSAGKSCGRRLQPIHELGAAGDLAKQLRLARFDLGSGRDR
jgi:hypothetical protein